MHHAGFKLTAGPILTYWPRRTVIDFYAALADTPIDTVTLGEIVCSRRHEMKLDDWLDLARDLAATGKEVVIGSQALIESEAELRTLRRIVDGAGRDTYLVEAGDAAALRLLAGRAPFVCGPHVNVYSRPALDELVALGAERWVPPVELTVEAIAAVAQPETMLEVEMFAFGRLPLAMSARCFTARHHGVNRDDCGFRCIDHPDGLTLRTQEGEPFLALNGLQTQSARVQCLLGWGRALATAGISRLRLSPTAHDFAAVIDLFHRVFVQGDDADVALAELRTLALPGAFADGFAHGAAGHAWLGAATPLSPTDSPRSPA